MGIKHATQSSKANSSNTSLISKNAWNENHTIDGDVDFNSHSIKNVDTVAISTATVIDFSGDLASIEGEAGTADILVLGTDPGTHASSNHFAQFIFANPTGGTLDTYPKADLALGIRAEKKNYYVNGTVIEGEVDGINVNIRTGGSADKSDTAGILIDSQYYGPSGGTSGQSLIEGVASRYNDSADPLFTLLYSVNAQWCAGNPSFVGLLLDALVGANSRAFYARENSTATWSALLFGESAAGVTFSIGIDGSMSWGTGDVLLTYSSNKLSVSGGSLECASYLKSGATVTGSLPAAATAGAGARYFVTDANTTTFNSTFSGSGANAVPVFSDGTNWRVG